MDQSLILGGSLIAILFLAALCLALGLGKGSVIRSVEEAREILKRDIIGFIGQEGIVSINQKSALVFDNDERVGLVLVHGNRFVTRVMAKPLEVTQNQNKLEVGVGELSLPSIILQLPDIITATQVFARLSGEKPYDLT